MNKQNKNHIADEGNGSIEWKMTTNLSILYHDDDMDELTEGCLYFDEQYGYYERKHTICSDTYASTFRFGKDKVGDVLKYIADSTPCGIEQYLLSLDGCEIIEQYKG